MRTWVLLLTLLLLLPAHAQQKAYHGNAYGRLTSEVWRYGAPFVARDLPPVANNNPAATPQPRRDRPTRLALSADGRRLYVTLQGSEAAPGHELAVIDVATKKLLGRIPVGSRPYDAVLHPGGRFLVVVNEFSNYATVIDTRSDTPAGIIPLDYYSQGLVFSADGRRAWVASRYLDQVLVLEIEERDDGLRGRVLPQGGFDREAYTGRPPSEEQRRELARRGLDARELRDQTVGGINAVLRARCGGCHAHGAGGYLAGDDAIENYLSAIEHAVPGRPEESLLLRAVTPTAIGGYGDAATRAEHHAGGVLFTRDDPELARILSWIRAAEQGPGILVGNPGSHPKDLALSADGRHLYVGNTGTQDISIVDTVSNREVGAIYLQNLANHLSIHRDPEGREQLIVLTLGAGFGTAPARDPYGAETRDRSHAAAQFSVLRDPKTTDPYPLARQHVLGPYDAIDGTWNIKMRDIQNDVVAVDLGRLKIPAYRDGMSPDYLLRAHRYEAHPGWVRYTSDTAEATVGDVKGDIPPELQRVHGAFPEWAALRGDRLYMTMAGTFEVVEWRIDPRPADAAERLVPLRKFDTGLRPVGIVAGDAGPAAGRLFVANQLGESVSVIDLDSGASREIPLGNLDPPLLATDAEKGALLVHTSVFTSDGDTSCLHCHVRDTGDGRGWGAAETVGQNRAGHLTAGGTLGIPSMRNIYAIQPYYFEGTHDLSEGQGADIAEPAASLDFDRPVWAGDFSAIRSDIPFDQRRPMHEEIKERVGTWSYGPAWHDMEARREAFMRQQSRRYFGAEHELRDLFRYVGAWLGDENHLLPNPYDREHPSVRRGARLFNSAQVMCGVCHTAPEFTNKSPELADNDRRALPPLTTVSARDASYTLVSVNAMEAANGFPAPHPGRVEEREGTFTTMQLRNIFDRPPVFLHHGRARSLREVLLTPGHPAARRYRLPVLQGGEEVRPERRETGFNELTPRRQDGALDLRARIVDSHGGTSQLSARQIEDLVNFMLAIE